MLAHCIVVLKYIYFIFPFKYVTEFSIHLPYKTTWIFFKYGNLVFFFPEETVSYLVFPAVMNPQRHEIYSKTILFDSLVMIIS